MDQTKQKQNDDTPVVSPLAQDKTYGERVYSGVFDWFLNYWTNLLASAGFSQWTSNTTRNVPFLQSTPRELQKNLGEWMSKQFFLKGYKKKQLLECGALAAQEKLAKGEITFEAAGKMLAEAEKLAEKNLGKRGFAMAESLTLLVPGFVVMIPSVWLGAKIKPWFVQKMNEIHYGKEAANDPSLQARIQAIRAEERPTLLGTIIARIGTVFAVQLTAKFIGSEHNTVNDIGKIVKSKSLREFPGINPTAEKAGEHIGNMVPVKIRDMANKATEKWGFSWSDKQMHELGKTGPYTEAVQDLSKYIAMDTIYTLVSSSTIHPLLNLMRKIPFMSYKPKVPANSATFDADGEKIKVPPNHYADAEEPARGDERAPLTPELDRASDYVRHTDEAPREAANDIPSTSVSHVREHAAMHDRHHSASRTGGAA